jgi:hypothetical protein
MATNKPKKSATKAVKRKGAKAKAPVAAEKKGYKLSDAEFWAMLRANGGLFSRTARAIEAKFQIPFTRQAVAERANNNPELLADIEEEVIDIAEESLQGLVRAAPPAVRLAAAQFLLKNKGKKRSYGDKPLEISATATQNGGENEETTEGKSFQLVIKVAGE